MNLFFYLRTFILNYSFIVILSDHIFVLCFSKTQPFVKRKPVKTEKNTGTIAFRFRQVLLYKVSESKTKKNHSNAYNFIMTSTYTWHTCSRWYTPDLYVVTIDIKHLTHHGTNTCFPR